MSDDEEASGPPSRSAFQQVLNELIFQLQAQMQFGGGKSPELSLRPGAVSQGVYYGASDSDPMGQSYYDAAGAPPGVAQQIQKALQGKTGNMGMASRILKQFRAQTPLSL